MISKPQSGPNLSTCSTASNVSFRCSTRAHVHTRAHLHAYMQVYIKSPLNLSPAGATCQGAEMPAAGLASNPAVAQGSLGTVDLKSLE